MSKEVDFYFDFASPNAYLSHKVMQSIKEKTGAFINITFGGGLLEPYPEERVHEESERYFDEIRYNRAYVPASYSSKDYGRFDIFCFL